MKVDYFRASSLNTFQSCQWSYYLQYVCGLPSITQKRAELGNIIHKICEILSRLNKNGHLPLQDKYCDPYYLLDTVFNRSNKVNPHFNFDKKDHKFCKDQIEVILSSHWDPRKLKILEVEHQFEFIVNKPGLDNIKMRGTIDLITESLLDPEVCELIDWKSGRRTSFQTGIVKELEDFQKDIQLRMYALAANEMYKKYKYFLITIFYTSDGGPFTVGFSRADIPDTIDKIRRLVNEIKLVEVPTRLIDNYASKQRWQCKWVCGFGQRYTDPITGKTPCQTYFEIFHQDRVNAASTIYQMSVEGKPTMTVSPRNDYSDPRGKIFKGTLE